jgi:flagellar motor switch protein FliG
VISASEDSRFVPQLESFDSADRLMSMRTSREKVAILLAALSKETAVSLLRKFDPYSIKQLLDSSGSLGDLNAGDFDPVVKEFTDEFAEALGISAGSEQLIPLLEAAFSQEKVSQLLGVAAGPLKDSVWSKFTPNMDALLVPFLLDENEQTAAVVLSKLSADLAVKCFALFPREATPRILARSLTMRTPSPRTLELLEQTLEEQFFTKSADSGGHKEIESVANLVNRMDRQLAINVLEVLAKTSPEQAAKLRKLIFMFEDLDRMQQKSRVKLFDRVPSELVTPALWGMSLPFKEEILASLSPRARRMVESELASDNGNARSDSLPARKKIAEIALAMARKGELSLPDESDSATGKSVPPA